MERTTKTKMESTHNNFNTNNTNTNNTNTNSNTNQVQNFYKFINHLLTFNKQMELLKNNKSYNPNIPFRFNISASVIIKLCQEVKPLFYQQPNIIHLEAPLNLFGDIHGQFSDLIHFLEMTGLPPGNKLLFMGDYVDRGNNSVEVCALLFAMKLLFPDSVQLLRGNHECPEVNTNYGLLEECKSRFGKDSDMVFKHINEVLCCLPLAAIINKKIFCVHGGISPLMKSITEIEKINRFGTIPDTGLLCDLMWSDPANTTDNWGMNGRGISCTYNHNAVMEFLRYNKLQLICRAHQLVSDGYKFFANNKLVTVFSAPNYCGNCGNDGAVMKINANLECSFIIIKPTNNDG